MLGRTNTGGGGSGGLNFQVIGGTTAPSNPKENMIWVNTSTKITSYIFSATQPTGSAGMVWISTGTYSTIEFNALKKNGIQVYPIYANQYISGAWVGKTAKSYQDGAWNDWTTILYSNGIESDITGGISRISHGNSYWERCSVTKEPDCIVCSGAYGNPYFSVVATDALVDVTNVKTIGIEVSAFTTNGVNTFGVLGTTTTRTLNDSIVNNANTKVTPRTGSITLDVSTLSGSYYIYFGATFENNNVGSMKITEVWML